MLLDDGDLATAWILTRFVDRLTEQEVDLIRSFYHLDDALTTGEIATKHHITGNTVVERRLTAVRTFWRLVEERELRESTE